MKLAATFVGFLIIWCVVNFLMQLISFLVFKWQILKRLKKEKLKILYAELHRARVLCDAQQEFVAKESLRTGAICFGSINEQGDFVVRYDKKFSQ